MMKEKTKSIIKLLFFVTIFALIFNHIVIVSKAEAIDDSDTLLELQENIEVSNDENTNIEDNNESTATEEIITEKREELITEESEELITEKSEELITEETAEEVSEDSCELVASAVYFRPVYDGVDYSLVFDYDYYSKNNPDVVSACSGNPNEILAHFVNCGMNEGRQASADFNVYSYAYLYPDLRRAYGNDLKAYYNHYISNGYNEGRASTGTTSMQGTTTVYEGVDYSSVYNYDYYTSYYPDIKNAFGLDDTACLKHFIDFGMSEGRRGSDDYDVISYKNTYVDLRAAFSTNLRDYYYHFINFGKSEGRIAKGSTKLIGCITSYNGKDYSSVYDFNYYVNNYSDMKRFFANDDTGALEHFVKCGMAEGRQGKENFDVWSYGYSYDDLRRAFGNNLPSYYIHYIENGKNEGRKLTAGVTSSNNENTIYADYDFSPIYDIVYYTGHNIDVRNAFKFDENAILEHFAQNGLNEGRKALASYSNVDYETAKEKVAEYNKKLEEERNKIKYPKAINVLNQVGWDLNAAFNWSVGMKYYSGVPKSPDPGINYFGDFGFDNGRGNCFVYAATFYEMAYTMGYNVRQIYGTVPLRAGGQGPHSWVEIDMDGGTYVFDPDMANEAKVNGFKFTYGTPGTWIYNKIEVMHE